MKDADRIRQEYVPVTMRSGHGKSALNSARPLSKKMVMPQDEANYSYNSFRVSCGYALYLEAELYNLWEKQCISIKSSTIVMFPVTCSS